MSCDSNARRTIKSAAASGAAQVAAKGAYVAGIIGQSARTRFGQVRAGVEATAQKYTALEGAAAARVAPVSNQALDTLNTLNRYGVDKTASQLVMGRLTRTAVGAPVKKALALAAIAKQVTGVVSGQAEGLARRDLAATVVADKPIFFFFKQKAAVPLWNSSLTPYLNARDQAVPKKDVLSSKGLSLKVNGIPWHRGVSVVQTPGGKRTIAHLQSLTYPGQHYYFDRSLSAKETVGILTRQPGYDPARMDGYIGQISEGETLAPGWAQAKGQLIKNRILNPPRGSQPNSRPPSRPPGYHPPRADEVKTAVAQGVDFAKKTADQAVQALKKR